MEQNRHKPLLLQIFLDDITIRLDDGTAFEHTDWQIFQGQAWGVIGATGSGKSLLLRSISRQVPLAGGRIHYSFLQEGAPVSSQYCLRGEVLTFSPETHRNFMRRFTSYHQARWQSMEGDGVPLVRELLHQAVPDLPGQDPDSPVPGDGSWPSRAWLDAVDMFDLAPLLERKVHQLSHGESRKAHIVSLLARGPQLLILDDPFAGLDEVSRAALMQGIEDLIGRGYPGVIIASSRMEDLCQGITHLAVVEGMRVIALGEKRSVTQIAEKTLRARRATKGCSGLSQDETSFDRMLGQYAASLETRRLKKSAEGDNDRPTPLLRMEDVAVSYNGKCILQDINWELRQGERWALLGLNGAGKTTLLSLIAADNPQAYANNIELFGVLRGSGESVWEIKKRIGWVSPEQHLFYHKNVSAFYVVCSGFFSSTGLYRRCSPEQKATAEGWMRALGIQTLKARPFLSLSTGQQRMAILARALVSHPPLLILDEPCQALDDRSRERMLRFIDRLCYNVPPVSMIYVTHIRQEIPSSISHYLLLERGKTVRQGPVHGDTLDLDETGI